MRTIEQVQIRKIYAIGNALGIKASGSGGDELHTLVGGVTGKDSIKSLTYKEACAVIARLEELQGTVHVLLVKCLGDTTSRVGCGKRVLGDV